MINYSEPEKKRNDKSNALITGLIFIAVGAILLLSNMNIVPWQWKRVFVSWQMLLIVIGIVQFLRKNISAGLILILIGGFFILPKLSFILPTWIRHNITDDFWPLLIVMVGLVIIIGAVSSNNKRKICQSTSNPNSPEDFSNIKSGDGYVNVNHVFSGSEQVFLEPVFRGGNIKTVFGGFTLDLRRTSLPEGISYLKLEAVFGGVTLIVPENWYVEVSQNSFLGGFSNNRVAFNYDPNKKLIIEANCVFGGGEVK